MMLRSPNKQSSSSPDLSKVGEGNVTMRKRKHVDDLSENFNSFTLDVMSTLNSWKIDMEKDITKINNGLTTKLNDAFFDMKSELTQIRKEYLDIKTSVQSLVERHSETVKEFETLRKSVQFHSDQYDDLNNKVKSLEDKGKIINELEIKIDTLMKENKSLQLELNMNNQRDRLLNLEILGVPELKGEDICDLVGIIVKQTGVDISRDDIVEVNRVTPRFKQQGRPRSIVVKMKSRLLKDNIISGARKNRLSTKDLNFPGGPKPIYVNEHLSPYNKRLLSKCREAAKIKQYRYVWSKNGRIFIRRNDTSPAVQIQEESDIMKIH